MIRIKCGTCGTSQGYKTTADGELSLPAAEEKRLVARGVADYVTRPVIGPAAGAGAPLDDAETGGADVTLPAGETGAEGAEAPENDIPDYSIDRKADQLRALLQEYDIPCSSGMTKADMVAALDAFFKPEAPAEDAPPELDAEGPVA